MDYHCTLSTYNVVKCVMYFALIFKLVETPRGGGFFDIFIHTYGLDHFWGFRKRIILGDMKKLWIFLDGHNIGLIWGNISIHLRALSLR